MFKFRGPKVYGAVTVGERGQVAIPIELRKFFGIKAGDKLIVAAKPGGPIGLIPVEQFNQLLSEMTETLAKINKNKTRK